MLYAIIPIQNSEEVLKDRLDRLKSLNICSIEAPNIYVVQFEGTTRQLFEIIGFGPDTPVANSTLALVVIPFNDIYGYANGEFWRWLKNNGLGVE